MLIEKSQPGYILYEIEVWGIGKTGQSGGATVSNDQRKSHRRYSGVWKVDYREVACKEFHVVHQSAFTLHSHFLKTFHWTEKCTDCSSEFSPTEHTCVFNTQIKSTAPQKWSSCPLSVTPAPIYINGVLCYVLLCIWLIWINIKFVRSFCNVAQTCASSFSYCHTVFHLRIYCNIHSNVAAQLHNF